VRPGEALRIGIVPHRLDPASGAAPLHKKESDMGITAQTTPTIRVPMDPLRKTALVAGIFYLITFISIPTLFLYGTVKTDQGWVTSSGSSTGVLWGGLLEVIVALAGIGTAVTLFPVVKRQNEGMALGFAAVRTVEAAMIFTGVVSLLSLVHLRQDFGATAAADTPSLVTNGASLVSTYNGAFLLGQTLMPCMSALLLGTLLYRSGLVPRALPTLGLIGAPLLITATIAVMFGIIEPISPWTALATLPIAVWEFSLGLWLTFKGFKACAITDQIRAERTPPAFHEALV
jgi:hypothetical protein